MYMRHCFGVGQRWGFALAGSTISVDGTIVSVEDEHIVIKDVAVNGDKINPVIKTAIVPFHTILWAIEYGRSV